MLLCFATANLLERALAEGAVPPHVRRAPARFCADVLGRVVIAPSVRPSPAAPNRLRRLGVSLDPLGVTKPTEPIANWLEAVPLRSASPFDRAASAALFELADGRQLVALAAELLRLGHDRLSFHFPSEGDGCQLEVVAPPSSALLWAGVPGVRVHLQSGPAVWVELGYEHPLAALIEPPPVGRRLFLSPPRRWRVEPSPEFRSVHDVPALPVSPGPVRADSTHPISIPLPLRLGRDPRPADAELWLLSDRPEQRLAEFVADADQRLLERFTFAIARRGPAEVVLLHGLADRGTLPVVVVAETALTAVAQFPNIFQPHGSALRPTVRREVVRRLFAEDPGTVIWLDGTDGLTAHGVPASAFRALSAETVYVVEAPPVALDVASPKPLLEFAPFSEPQDRRAAPRKPSEMTTDQTVEIPPLSTGPPGIEIVKGQAPPKTQEPPRPAVVPELPVLAAMPDAELRRRLAERQTAFLALTGPHDDPARRALWPELADLHGAVELHADAAVCWANALWDTDPPPPEWLHAWLRVEQKSGRSNLSAHRLDRILTEPSPPPDMVRHAAVGLIASLGLAESPHLRPRANLLAVFLEQHEAVLPVRVAWLAWLAVSRLAGGDVLLLARSRDRLLGRLLEAGLSRDRDLPAFLRDHTTAGVGTDHDRLTRMYQAARTAPMSGHAPEFIDLTFAFGFARAGETDSARELLGNVERVVRRGSVATYWLFQAYRHRIRLVLDGQPHAGGLPSPLLQELAGMASDEQATAVNLYRRVSRILEPYERINPFLKAHLSPGDRIGEELGKLTNVTDPADLARRLTDLRRTAGPRSLVRVLAAALTYSPRLGDVYAADVLTDLERAVRTGPPDDDLFRTVDVLENAMMVAAHVGREERVPPFFQLLHQTLDPLRGERLAWLVGQLNGQLFRTLGKLGLRDEVGPLVDQLFDQMLEGRTLDQLRQTPAVNWGIVLRALLQVAGGWFYLGKDGAATAILDLAQERLWLRTLRDEEQVHLAVAYATTLGQAPAVVAWPRIDKLFDRLGQLDAKQANSKVHKCEFRTVEAAVLAVVAKDFSAGSTVRRWLDGDEFLVRHRIHADVRRELVRTGMGP